MRNAGRLLKSQDGFTIYELMLAAGFMAFASAGSLSFVVTMQSSYNRNQATTNLLQTKKEILSSIGEKESLVYTIADTTNTSMKCLRDGTACQQLPAGQYHDIRVRDYNNQLVSLVNDPFANNGESQGIDSNGAPCAKLGQGTCNFKVSAQWRPDCAGDPCLNPGVSIRIKYSATGNLNGDNYQGALKNLAFNVSYGTFAAGADDQTCLAAATDETLNADKVKIIWVVDQSGSNDWTDKKKSFRGGRMQKFYTDNKDNEKLAYQLLEFHDSNSKSLMTKTKKNQVPQFSEKSEEFDKGIENFLDNNDDGGTPYRAAINYIKKVIAGDPQFQDSGIKYSIAFMSDGMPSDYKIGKKDVDMDQLLKDVGSVLDLAPGRISFNTLYYGEQSEESRITMKMMAERGKGVFLDTNAAGQSFELDDFVKVPSNSCKNTAMK